MSTPCDAKSGGAAPKGIVSALLCILVPLGILGAVGLVVAASQGLVGYSAVWAFVAGLLVAVLAILSMKRGFRIKSLGVVTYEVENDTDLGDITRVDLTEKSRANGPEQKSNVDCDPPVGKGGACQQNVARPGDTTTIAIVTTHHASAREEVVPQPTVHRFAGFRAPKALDSVLVHKKDGGDLGQVFCRIDFVDEMGHQAHRESMQSVMRQTD